MFQRIDRYYFTKLKEMKFPWTLMVMLCLVLATTPMKSNPINNNNSELKVNDKTATFSLANISDDLVQERLAQLDLPMSSRYTTDVKSLINRYLVNGYRGAEDIIGRSSIYFSIFEHYLKVYNLPEELKYLPILESTLKPRSYSHVGAAGLWQFVPATGRQYDLAINNLVDERLDPYKATEAAVQMLANLYDQFGDWGLVLAAYNCGPGRVRQAMRRADCHDFWDVQPYLPRESQRYVPGFIAAAYLMNYYNLHGLAPDYPAYDLQDTRAFMVFNRLSLRSISNNLDVDYNTLVQLNPSYLQAVVPSSSTGNYVVVPSRIAEEFQDSYGQKSEVNYVESRLKTSYVTVPGDTIETLAALFQCTPEAIMHWNGLQKGLVTVNQILTVYLPRASAKP